MGRFGGRGGGGGGGGGGRRGGGFHSSSGLTSKNRKDGCVAANSGSSSWSWTSWWSSYDEESECRQLYVLYNECLGMLEDKKDDYRGCYSDWQQFEGPCGKYKSRWSSWWTERDEKNHCKGWSEVYQRKCLNSENPDSICGHMGEITRRVCRGVKLK